MGVLVWQGTSLIDKKTHISAVASLSSTNRKTGNMAQVYILPTEGTPAENYKAGKDSAVCGKCPLSSLANDGSAVCYTNPAWMTSIHSTIAQGVWYQDRDFLSQEIRFGAYGDPAAVPLDVWSRLAELSSGWTGYTHQWQEPRVQPYQQYLMASADNPDEALRALDMGWRVYTVRPKGSDWKPKGFISCPADKTDNKVQCRDCMQCSGNGAGRTVSVVIDVHGAKSRDFTWEEK